MRISFIIRVSESQCNVPNVTSKGNLRSFRKFMYLNVHQDFLQNQSCLYLYHYPHCLVECSALVLVFARRLKIPSHLRTLSEFLRRFALCVVVCRCFVFSLYTSLKNSVLICIENEKNVRNIAKILLTFCQNSSILPLSQNYDYNY